MSKVIVSKIPRWPGSVTISDPLTIAQARLIEDASDGLKEGKGGKVWLSVIDGQQEPAVLACVEKWDLQNFSLTDDGHFPASPRRDSHKLMMWIFGEIAKVYNGELDVPNASSPTPTDTQAPDSTAEK